LALAGQQVHTIDRVRLQPGTDGTGNARVRQFEIWVATDSYHDSDFQRVLVAEAANNDTLQEFVFPGGPVVARYVKYVPLSSQDATNARIGTSRFQVISTANVGTGGVVAASSQSNTADLALDRDPTTLWLSAAGQSTDQWLTVLVAGEEARPIHGVTIQSANTNQAPSNFAVQVSTTTADDAAFTTVYTGTHQLNSNRQEYFFPEVTAKFVRLFLFNNQGNSCCVGVAEFDILGSTAADTFGWQTQNTLVSLPAVDNPGGSGIAKTELVVPNPGYESQWQQYNGPYLRSEQGSERILYRSTDFAHNQEDNHLQLLLTDPTLTVGRQEAGQHGIEWLSVAVNNKSQELKCVACHVQGDALHGLALGSATGYEVDSERIEELVDFLLKYQDEATGLWLRDDPTTNSSHSLFGLAFYDRYVSTRASQELLAGVDGMIPRQQANGRWVNNDSRRPSNYSDMQTTAQMIFALNQAKLHADLSTIATYQQSLDAAQSWIAAFNTTGSTISTQEKAMKLLALVEAGVAREDTQIVALKNQLLSEQLADGGWREHSGFLWSSSFATGQTLYALCTAGVSRYEPQVAKGIQWLIHHQASHTPDAYVPYFVMDGPWPLRYTNAQVLFATTLWPVMALGCYGEINYNLSAAPSIQLAQAGQATAQTLSVALELNNIGAEADTYTLVVDGGVPGWSASFDSNPVTVDEGETLSFHLTITLPPNQPEHLTGIYTIRAISQKDPAIERFAQTIVTTSPV
ncbi:MAG: discoidin domain-containing protein, partial [Caldilineaceae bacterium]|nr:discoidin domain-containing protein [Caldilineaceae bacterium]